MIKILLSSIINLDLVIVSIDHIIFIKLMILLQENKYFKVK